MFNVIHNGNGIGDSLSGLPICCGIREKHYGKINYIIPEKNRVWTELFNAGIDSYNMGNGTTYNLSPCYLIEEREKGRLGRMDYYSAACDNVEPIMPTIKELPTTHLQNCVVLCPESEWKIRQWLLPNWLWLEDEVRKLGERVVILGTKFEIMNKFKSEKYVNGEPAKVAAIIQDAKLVIGIDSALTWLSALLDTPTIAICGSTKGKSVFSFFPSVQPIEGIAYCSGCYGETISPECNSVCASVNLISPIEVTKKAKMLLATQR